MEIKAEYRALIITCIILGVPDYKYRQGNGPQNPILIVKAPTLEKLGLASSC